jgi:excisionase family DNA binding protein
MPGVALEDLLRQLLQDVVRVEVRVIVREELAAALHAPLPSAVASTAPSQPSYLSPQQAAEVAGVSEKTLRRWLQRGDLPRCSLGRLVRIERSDLERFLSGGGSSTPSKVTVDDVVTGVLSGSRRSK